MKTYQAEILSTKTHNGKTRLSLETLQSTIRRGDTIHVKNDKGEPIGLVKSMKLEGKNIVCTFIVPFEEKDIVGKHLVPVITLNFKNLMEEVRYGFDVIIHSVTIMDKPQDPNLAKIKEV